MHRGLVKRAWRALVTGHIRGTREINPSHHPSTPLHLTLTSSSLPTAEATQKHLTPRPGSTKKFPLLLFIQLTLQLHHTNLAGPTVRFTQTKSVRSSPAQPSAFWPQDELLISNKVKLCWLGQTWTGTTVRRPQVWWCFPGMHGVSWTTRTSSWASEQKSLGLAQSSWEITSAWNINPHLIQADDGRLRLHLLCSDFRAKTPNNSLLPGSQLHLAPKIPPVIQLIMRCQIFPPSALAAKQATTSGQRASMLLQEYRASWIKISTVCKIHGASGKQGQSLAVRNSRGWWWPKRGRGGGGEELMAGVSPVK